MDVAFFLDMNMNMTMSIDGLILISSTKDPLWYGYLNIYYKLVPKVQVGFKTQELQMYLGYCNLS